MAWTEIDLARRTWTLSRERTKADRAHVVPLSSVALAIIEACPKLGPSVLSSGRAEQLGGWSRAKRRLDLLATERLRAMNGDADAEITDWHLHDLRRTAATYMAEGGADRIVISKVLNHAETSVTGIYDRFQYLDAMRTALERWSVRLEAIMRMEARSSGAAQVISIVGMK